MNPYFAVFKKYADFNGRARRSEYWGFILINAPILFMLAMIDIAMYYNSRGGFPYLTLLYYLAVFVPALAVQVRRLHDTGRSGWWCFLGLIPFAGAIVLFVFMVVDTEPGPNRYGPNPKEVSHESTVGIRPGLILVGVLLLLVGASIATSVYLPRFLETKDLSSYQTDDRDEPFTPENTEKIEAEAARMNTGLEARVTQHSSGVTSYGATVEVINRSTKTYDWVMVEVEFCDKAGQVVSTLKTDARGGEYILPDGVKSFEVRGDGKLDYRTVRASVVYSVEVK